MLVRLCITVSFLLCATICFAQNDTTFLKEVVIESKGDAKFLAGSTIRALDSTVKTINSSRHLGEVLSFQFPIYFRNYGNGMLSSVSFRGTSAQHTAVLWNGVSINSFSLGQADFSMLPATAFENIEVHAGGGSARFGSGAFGGTILLSSFASSKNSISLSQEFGSFGRYFSSLALKFSDEDISYASSFYHLQAENNFPILETDLKQTHAAFLLQGITQNIRYKITEHAALGLHYWFHTADRELQAAIGTVNNTDEQQDENHRLLLTFENRRNNALLNAQLGFIDDELIYNKSKSSVQRWVMQVNQKFLLKNIWMAEWSVQTNHIKGFIKEYEGGQADENRAELAVAVNRDFKMASLAFNVRQPFISQVDAPLLFYAGADIQLAKSDKVSLATRINASKNFRAPTLNDRYWGNVGNRDLLPEESYASEVGIEVSNSTWKIGVTGFYQLVDQWIQWKPLGDNGAYVPKNLLEVEVMGLETSFSWQQVLPKGLVAFTLSSQHLQSILKKVNKGEEYALGKQLTFTPKNLLSMNLNGRYKQFSAHLLLQATDKRFTDDTNTNYSALEAYALVDFSFGYSFHKAPHQWSIVGTVKNLTDSNYQLYIARAQPGRNFSIQINYKLTPKLK